MGSVTRDFAANLIGGGLASMCAQLIIIPIDTITQRFLSSPLLSSLSFLAELTPLSL